MTVSSFSKMMCPTTLQNCLAMGDQKTAGEAKILEKLLNLSYSWVKLLMQLLIVRVLRSYLIFFPAVFHDVICGRCLNKNGKMNQIDEYNKIQKCTKKNCILFRPHTVSLLTIITIYYVYDSFISNTIVSEQWNLVSSVVID